LTNGQIARLLFDGQPNANGEVRALFAAEKAASKTLRRLWESRFVDRKPMILTSKRTGLPYHHFVNVLTAAGAAAVGRRYEEEGRDQEVRWTRASAEVSNQTVEHALAINDLHVLLKRACVDADVRLFAWRDDRQLSAMNRAKQTHFLSIPDAFFVLAKNGRARGHFVEIDRGTESIGGERSRRIWRDKIEGYGRYFRERYDDEDFFEGVADPIVLAVTTGRTRLVHMLEAAHETGVGARCWHATSDELNPERLVTAPNGQSRPLFEPNVLWKPVWRTPGDRTARSLTSRLFGETPR